MSRNFTPLLVIIGIIGFFFLAYFVISNGGVNRLDRSVIGFSGVRIALSENDYALTQSDGRSRYTPESFDAQIVGLYDIDLYEPVDEDGANAPRQISSDVLENKLSQLPSILILPKWQAEVVETKIANDVLAFPIDFYPELFDQLDEPDLEIAAGENQFYSVEYQGIKGAIFAPHYFEREGLSQYCRELMGFELGALVVECPSVFAGRPLVLVSDPDLFNNHGLANADNQMMAARFVSDWLARLDIESEARIYLDDTNAVTLVSDKYSDERVNYARDFSDIARFFSYPLSLVWAVMFALMGLLLWRGFVRFGEVQKTQDYQVEMASTAAVEAMSRILRLSGNDSRMIAEYVRMRLDRFSRQLLGDAAGRDSIEYLFSYLERKNAPHTAEFVALSRDLRKAHERSAAAETYSKFQKFRELAKKVVDENEFN